MSCLHIVLKNTLTGSVHAESVATPPSTTLYLSVPGSAAVGTPISGVDFTLSKADDAAPVEQVEDVSKADQQAGGIEGVAAADYDPSMDDEARRAAKRLAEDVDMHDVVEEVDEEGEEEDDIDDIFALVDEDEPKPKKKKKVKLVKVRLLSCLSMARSHILL